MATVRGFPDRLTQVAYWLAPALPLLLPLGWSMRGVPGMEIWFAWLSLLVLYVLLPAADIVLGRDQRDPALHDSPSGIDRVVPVAAAGTYLVVLFWALDVWATHPGSFTAWSTLGWTLSLANLGGVVAINVAHELIHRRSRRGRLLGGLLLSCVWYPGFKLEHPFWHHLHVATPRDPSSAPRGSTVYRQVPRAIVLNTIRGWKLAFDQARKRGRKPAWLINEMNAWCLLSIGLTVGTGLWLGGLAMLMFLAHGVGAMALLEVINYVEHYGLQRERSASGRYERPQASHSWDSDFWLSNALLLQLPRHADHHLNPNRPFSALQRSAPAPKLPFGYSSAVLVAMIPPLWRKVVEPGITAAN